MTSTSPKNAPEQQAELVTRGGMTLHLRPVEQSDGPIVADLFTRLSPEDLRFRFLGSRKVEDMAEIAALLDVDHWQSEHLLAFDAQSGELAASLMIVADDAMETAEVAIAVAERFRGRGAGWTLLRHAADLARKRGIRRLCSIESRDNHDALEVERALGFRSREFEGDPGLVILEAKLADDPA